MSKRFPLDLLDRGIVKTTDKLLIHNIDTGVTEYTTVAQLFAALSNLASGQLKFPVIQNPSADVNTLDDYEEGTFTATMVCGTSGTITLTANRDLLSYTKIGRIVIINGFLNVTSVNVPVGSLRIDGLPFPSAASVEAESRTAIAIKTTALEAAALTSIQASISESSSSIYIYRFENGACNDAAALVKAGSQFTIGGAYIT
jgi:hypothetical protein